ncbi:MAG: hypothetical protein KDC90_08130, partial [Ignavibacteriae bacterium]|nr:hypothetical protein [Ignavibacteriota bacterium]
MERLILCFLLILFLLPYSNQSSNLKTNNSQNTIDFYAYFKRIVNTDDNFVRIYKMEMSGDGNKIIFSGSDIHTDPAVYTINSDGSELTKIPLPDEMGGIPELTINYDGSKAYFYNTEFNRIYKVENGVCERIFDVDNYDYVFSVCGGIETTADGLSVYFVEYQGDIWRIGSNGGIPGLIIDDQIISRDKGFGAKISGFDISDDGKNIVFKLLGYIDQDGWFQTKEELFVYSNGAIRQITNHLQHTLKESYAISGNGEIVVYNVAEPENKWYSINKDGSNQIAIGDMGFNFGGMELTYNGKKSFYNDASSNGGRIVNCNSNGCLDLFDGWEKLIVSYAAQLDNAGNKVCFISQYAAFPMKEAIYVGYLNNEESTSWSPRIKDTNFDPDFMPKGNPEAAVKVITEVRRDDDFGKLEFISGATIIDGIINTSWENTPIVWGIPFHDDGLYPDLMDNDELFTTYLTPGDKINDYEDVTIRVAALDSFKNMVVADFKLGIGAPVNVINYLTNDCFILFQNYPNPFNPITTIKYQLPAKVKSETIPTGRQAVNVKLIVFDILGREVTTLVNQRQNPGNYEV